MERTLEKGSEDTFEERAKSLLKETKLLQITKSANILISLFGFEKAFDRISEKCMGTQIEMHFPALEGSLTFTMVSSREEFECEFGAPEDPAARIIMNVNDEDILKLISEILILKDNLFGLMRLVPMMLTGKIKIKGSYIAAILLCRTMMIGKHEMYDGQL